ncbi:hypothetical protein J6590_051550 [Homalodisca vitripennis]|nr:hypothetical protein J6590_051550 [Homalodisca vitripennis]
MPLAFPRGVTFLVLIISQAISALSRGLHIPPPTPYHALKRLHEGSSAPPRAHRCSTLRARKKLQGGASGDCLLCPVSTFLKCPSTTEQDVIWFAAGTFTIVKPGTGTTCELCITDGHYHDITRKKTRITEVWTKKPRFHNEARVTVPYPLSAGQQKPVGQRCAGAVEKTFNLQRGTRTVCKSRGELASGRAGIFACKLARGEGRVGADRCSRGVSSHAGRVRPRRRRETKTGRRRHSCPRPGPLLPHRGPWLLVTSA